MYEEIRIVLDIQEVCTNFYSDFHLKKKLKRNKSTGKAKITSNVGRISFACLLPVCNKSLWCYMLYIIYKLRQLREGDLSRVEIFKNIDTQTRTPIARRTNVKAMSVNAITTFF